MLLHCILRVWPFIFGNVSPVPPGEVYFANDVAFQLIIFACFFLPLWLVGLAVVLLLESVFLRLRAQPHEHDVIGTANAPYLAFNADAPVRGFYSVRADGGAPVSLLR